jgi:hypothetical protein
MTPHERRRALLWTACCMHRAVLPWVRTVLRLAQAAENDAEYRTALAVRTRLSAQLAEIEAELWRLDPDWSREVVAPCSPLAKLRKEMEADGTPESPHPGP